VVGDCHAMGVATEIPQNGGRPAAVEQRHDHRAI
jgi:hypothetical protein